MLLVVGEGSLLGVFSLGDLGRVVDHKGVVLNGWLERVGVASLGCRC